MKELYNPRAFITHAAWLDQACAHCPIFPTAASRRSLGRVSVPVWLIILSNQLSIIALVGHYPTNQLIKRRFLHKRITPLTLRYHAVLAPVSQSYPPLMDRSLRVTHPSATNTEMSVRLACVKHAASVRSEPGSNSQVHPHTLICKQTHLTQNSYSKICQRYASKIFSKAPKNPKHHSATKNTTTNTPPAYPLLILYNCQ